jgi:hypothetical protein
MTLRGWPLFRFAAISIGGAFLVAGTSLFLGARVNYLDHLSVFNALAATMLTLGVVGLACSVVGLWKARLRSMPFSITATLSLLFLIRIMLDG